MFRLFRRQASHRVRGLRRRLAASDLHAGAVPVRPHLRQGQLLLDRLGNVRVSLFLTTLLLKIGLHWDIVPTKSSTAKEMNILEGKTLSSI